jgi:hypothetical protein
MLAQNQVIIQNPVVSQQPFYEPKCCFVVQIRNGFFLAIAINIGIGIYSVIDSESWVWSFSILLSCCGLYGGYVKNPCLVRLFAGFLIFETVAYAGVSLLAWIVRDFCGNDEDNSDEELQKCEDELQTIAIVFLVFACIKCYFCIVSFQFAGTLDRIIYSQAIQPTTMVMMMPQQLPQTTGGVTYQMVPQATSPQSAQTSQIRSAPIITASSESEGTQVR